MVRAHSSLVQSAALLRSHAQPTNAAACLIKAFFLSEGFVELSSLYCTILYELLQPVLGMSHIPPAHTSTSVQLVR